jgi:hypothetical protein
VSARRFAPTLFLLRNPRAKRVKGLCPSLAHSDAFATQFTSASDQSGHTSRRRSVAVECNGATPAPGGVALYLAAKRPLDRARKRFRAIRVTIAPPRTPAAYATPASITQTIRTGAVVPPACCTMAAASTYIRSSASGSYQNPAYSWQLGSKMDGTHLSYG